MTRNQRSSSVSVRELTSTSLSGLVRSTSPSVVEAKFQRFRAAYVAQGGSSKRSQTCRKGLVMGGGSLYGHQGLAQIFQGFSFNETKVLTSSGFAPPQI